MNKMLKLPVRKCYHVAKVTLLFVLVIAILTLFEQWRGGKRSALAYYADPEENAYEKEILEDEARIIPGLGEGGNAAYLTGEDKEKGKESEKKLAMNVYLSDRIAYNRSLSDHRNPACTRVQYDAELPSASVIIIFHNEPYSVVIRTLWSVINSCRRDQPWHKKAKFIDNQGKPMKLGYPDQDPNSEHVYLKEIILVDDNSTLPQLKGKLSHYIRTRLPPDLIRIIRLPERYGLTAARLRGARAARGSVLVFLDAHCEAQEDWLRPLLQRIRDKRDAVLTPIIDVIDQSSFHIDAAGETFQVGGFTFTGHFTWIDVPDREKRRRGSDISPTWSPTMAGGLFAMDRQYYWELGAYDEQMAGWGGENLEMSFRVWQCGGTLETIPCSRVGHVFRAFHPYSMPASSDTHGINTARMAEVWMDEYAELFYLYRPDLRNNPKIGDVTHRKILREKLHCKNFQWYLDNIYMEKFVPVRDAYGYGRIQNPSSGLCIDTLQREGEMVPLGVYPCHATLAATQHFSLSMAGQLRDEENCAMLQFNRRSAENEDEGVPVLMTTCRGHQRSQKWRYVPETQHITHAARGLCLDAGRSPGADLRARPCAPVDTQRWKIDYTEDNGFRLSDGQELTKQETRLLKLRGQKRKSRSLLSMPDKPDKSKRSQRRHRKRARGNKNKFILKLVRTASNGSKEHLEVEIHCKHQQLFPNNTFVRDLVSILNEKDIKVINNGRVFEKNRITAFSDKEKEPDRDRERDREREREKERDKDRESEKEKEKDRESDREKEKEYERETRFDDEVTEPAMHRKRASTAGEQRIIIEDFVGYTTPRREVKRKHRKHHKQTTTTKPVHTRVLEDSRSLPNYKERYSDDSLQLTDADEKRWDNVNTLFRNNSSHTSWRRAYEGDDKNNDFHNHSPPVKVMMRSNLTFKLADSFFKKPRDVEKDSIDTDNAMFNVDMSIPEDHLKFGTTAAADDIHRAIPLPPTGNESSDSKDNSDAR